MAARAFRVRDLAGGWHPVELAPGMSEAGVRDAVAGVVRLAPGSFSLVNAEGGGAGFHAGLVGDWEAALLPGQAQPAGAGAGAGANAAAAAAAAPTFEALLIAGGVAAPQPSVVRRAFTRYGGAVVAALAGGGRAEAAVDAYRLAESLPSLTTAEGLRLEGIDIDGPLFEGSPAIRCFRNRAEFVLKPLDEREHECARTLLDALNRGETVSGITPFELRSSAKGKHFMLMPLFGAALEALPRLHGESVEVLWRCARDALCGLHALGFAHMDVKPANICLDRRAFVLIDLGSAARFGEPAATTLPYVPADFPGRMRLSSARADWWLLAMTLAEKATGLRVGGAPTPTMAALRERLSVGLPSAVWAELREKLVSDDCGGDGGAGRKEGAGEAIEGEG